MSRAAQIRREEWGITAEKVGYVPNLCYKKERAEPLLEAASGPDHEREEAR